MTEGKSLHSCGARVWCYEIKSTTGCNNNVNAGAIDRKRIILETEKTKSDSGQASLQGEGEVLSNPTVECASPDNLKNLRAAEFAGQQSGQKTNIERDLIRTIHHFACTGGTLFSKCIAAMDKTMVLNEVNPFFRYSTKGKGVRFTPTDLISLGHQSGEDLDAKVVQNMFLTSLEILQEEACRTGRALVIRDHIHSQYLVREPLSFMETTLGLVKTRFSVKSLVTVRDPIDSFLSLERNGWVDQFQPSTFDEYCARYLKFLSDFKGVPIIRFEDFISHPKRVMREICEILNLSYDDSFQNHSSSFRFSGDSGRTGSEISERPRLEVSEEFLRAVSASDKYIELANLNGYGILQ